MAAIKSVDVILIRAAKKGGGDRYEGNGLVIYIPQDVSRKDNTPRKGIRIKFEEVE